MAINEDVKVIIASGNIAEDVVGVFAVLRKPFNLPQLRETVREAVG